MIYVVAYAFGGSVVHMSYKRIGVQSDFYGVLSNTFFAHAACRLIQSQSLVNPLITDPGLFSSFPCSYPL